MIIDNVKYSINPHQIVNVNDEYIISSDQNETILQVNYVAYEILLYLKERGSEEVIFTSNILSHLNSIFDLPENVDEVCADIEKTIGIFIASELLVLE